MDNMTTPTQPAPVRAQETMDAELIGLAALAYVEAVQMSGDNRVREMQGFPPIWADGTGTPPASTALRDELYKRGYKL